MTTSEKKLPTITSHLRSFTLEGVALYIDGHSATPDEIADCCVNEDTLYMPDYITDESGVLKEIRYDRITLR